MEGASNRFFRLAEEREKERKSVQAIPRVQVQVARGTTAVLYGDVEYKVYTGRRESGYCETGGRRLGGF